MKEHILCAAVWYKDGKKYENQPVNVDTGIVVMGMRHDNCISTIISLLKSNHQPYLTMDDSKGFVTSFSRFIGRKEAYILAKESGQLLVPHDHDQILTSTDLY